MKVSKTIQIEMQELDVIMNKRLALEKRRLTANKYKGIIQEDVLFSREEKSANSNDYFPTTGILAAIDLSKSSKKIDKKVRQEFELLEKHKKNKNSK